MIDYPDTSFLFAFYLRQSTSSAAAAYAASATEPLNLTDLVRFEFRQSIRFQVWRNAAKRTEGVNRADAQAALSQLDEDLKNGVAVLHPCSLREILIRADELSELHTVRGGHRSFDVLHVATALVLNAEKLLTFDQNQRALAKAAGLKVGP
jgi:predicted nucleic acid-binding protein